MRRLKMAVALLLLAAPPGWANEPITVKGVIQTMSCVINGGKEIDVDFGSTLKTTLIDGSQYKTKVVYTVRCSGNSSNALKMQIKGSAAGFDATALATDKTNLGLALLKDGKKQTINSWFNFSYPTLPGLEMVPVKKAGVTLSTGDFNATATLMVDVQ
ncbi:fimbrial protein [Serratia proteamaculans]|uniref:fimbrial protein n=1 Tax=Serratia proteamaculans TaxID=28151 RepID=UPI0021790FE6|nr:fimbrial protein [Serratia proteamaculans]CAI1710303.1 Minor fimbrial protein prsF precursor [Serratia proteamaculans]CAI2510135.1 Minor fimbrial protein prsF precursor [Serratia proteamaculans]